MADSFLILQSVLEPYFYSTEQKLIADLETQVVGPAMARAQVVEDRLKGVREKWLPWQNR